MNPTPTIHLSPDTGTITNALDLAAWLRHHSPAWSATEAIARKHQMTRMETLELLALTLGLQLEHARQQSLDADPPRIDSTPPLPGFEICEDTFAPPISMMDHLLNAPMSYEAPSYEQTVVRLGRAPGEPLPETLRPKDPADLAPALFCGLGLFFAIAAGVLLVNGHGLAAALCGATCVASLVRASRFPA